MQVNVIVKTDDLAKGHVGFNASRHNEMAGSNPMVPDEMESGYEVGYDAGFKDSGWTGKFIRYTVKEGDTAESIAQEFHVKPKDLILLNRKEGNLTSDNVNVGQVLKIPEMEVDDAS